jgi:hypothetical protein
VSSRKRSISHLTFCLAISFFLVVGTIVSINGIGLNLSGTAFAQQQPQVNFTSIEQQQLMEGISFEIDNVTFHIIWRL